MFLPLYFEQPGWKETQPRGENQLEKAKAKARILLKFIIVIIVMILSKYIHPRAILLTQLNSKYYVKMRTQAFISSDTCHLVCDYLSMVLRVKYT